ncbi:MAG TPA: DUF3261 domain-containing protein [Candidatus Binatia bacterium]
MFVALPGRQVALVGSLTLLLTGCVAPSPRAAGVGLKLAPAALAESISLQQRLDIEGQGRRAQLDVVLEVDAERIDLVGLAFGQRVLSMSYDGKTLQSWRHPMWPAQVRAEEVLENIQLTLWPVDAIRRALPMGWSIKESGLRRTLLQDGLAVMVIDYSALPFWSGKVEVANLQFNYRITIQSVSNEP